MKNWTRIAIFALALSSLCFAGRVSIDDKEYLQSRPYFVKEEGRYFIEWTQGEWPFAFFPDTKISNGKAIFEVKGTSSSGDLRGRIRRDEIKKNKIKSLIDLGEAYWKEPNGTLIRLEFKSESNQSPQTRATSGPV